MPDAGVSHPEYFRIDTTLVIASCMLRQYLQVANTKPRPCKTLLHNIRMGMPCAHDLTH